MSPAARLSRVFVSLAVVAITATGGLGVVASAAHADNGACLPTDPYTGGQTCYTAPHCTLDFEVVDGGTRIRFVATGFAQGDNLTGTVNGIVVFHVTTTDGNLDLTVPIPDLGPGSYPVAVSGTSGLECDPPLVIPGPSVLGTQFTRGDNATAAVSGTALARTGIDVVLLVLLGVGLVVAGGALRRAAPGRHRRG